jgi:PmbA protein
LSTSISLEVDLKELALDVVVRAMKSGATEADAVVQEGDEFTTIVRHGEVETLKEAGGRGLGLRVFFGQRSASSYTSDLSLEGVERLIAGAMELARVTSEDSYGGLPEKEFLGTYPQDLQLYHADVYSLPTRERIEYAKRAERAALDADKRIVNSDGASFDASTGRTILANSLGFLGEYRTSYCGISMSPIAQEKGGTMQSDRWFSNARTLGKLETPESIGKEAARRTLRRLGARKVPTARVPVVFEPQVGRSVIGHFADAANGSAIYHNSSFFEGLLGKQVAAAHINVVDDNIMPGGFGSSPFDGEGVASRRTVLVKDGVLQSYLLNTYVARKLKMQTTGNAARSLAGNPGIGSGNFYLQPGTKTPQEIIGGIKSGLYVTDLIGHGVNLVTGDYSQGASGVWIENGELTYPVEEITVAGNLKDMFMNISEVGNDLVFRNATVSPTFRIDGMTVAGS